MSLQTRLAALIGVVGLAFKADRARLDAIEARLSDRYVFNDASVSTVASTTFQNKLNNTVVLDGGTYRITVSYGFNYDSTAQDFLSRFLIDGVEAHTGAELQRYEHSESAGTFGATGTDQKLGFTRVFDGIILTAGSHQFQLQWAGSSGTVNSSIWDALVTVERVSL